MDEPNNIERKIKEGFENSDHKAPDNIWSSINDQLENDPNSVDNKIKTSFESSNISAPEGIWKGIDKQLTIDRGWVKIHKLLQRRTAYKWAKRVAAFLIFLFFVSSESTEIFPGINGRKLSENNNLFSLDNHQQLMTQKQNTNLNKTPSKDLLSSNQSNKTELLSKTKKDIAKKNKNNNTEKTGFSDEVNTNKAAGVNSNIENSSTSSGTVEKENLSDSQNLSKLPVKSLNALPTNNIKRDIIDVELNFDLPEEKKFELGVFTAINTTAIVNNTTIRAFDAKSLVAFDPSFGTNLGVQFIYHFNKKHGWASSLTHSGIRQSYKKFSKGSLNDETAHLNFIRLHTMYQFKLKPYDAQKSAFNIRVGPYFGFMTKSTFTVNNELDSDSLNYFCNYDFGLSLQAGHSVNWNSVVLDYGLNLDKGLINLNKGTDQIPASFDRSTTIGLGAYISLRYKF